MEVRGFHHIAIQVRSLERVARFYCEVLGLKELKRHYRVDGGLRSIWIELPGSGFIALEESDADGDARPPRLGYSLLALAISRDQRKRIIKNLTRCGIAIARETQWTFYVADPEGNEIGLSHYPDPPST